MFAISAIMCMGLVILTFIKSVVSKATFLQAEFERNFHETCSKYRFVDNFVKNMENPSDRFVVFVYHENGLKNGGLGDRLGGLISATMIALRLNRTLLIQSANGFDKLFRPYSNNSHHFEPTPENKWTYTNWTSWTKYNPSFSDQDTTEYDLWDCINCVARNDGKCGLDYSDVDQNIIKLRSNRAYLCKWAKHTDILAHEQIVKQGVTAGSDLLEAAGCLLRLAMWPTQHLWDVVDKLIAEELYKLGSSVDPDNAISMEEYSTMHKVGMHYRCGDRSYIHPGSYDRFCEYDSTGKDPHEVSPYFDFGNPFDAGMCARRVLKNFTHSVLHKEGLAHEGTFHPDGVANMDHHPAIGSIKRHRQRRALAANTEHDPKKKLHHEEAEEGEERVDKKGEEGDVGAANFGRVELATQTITTDQRSSYTSYISSSSNSFRGTGSSIELNSSSISQNARKLTLANNPVFRKGVRALVYIASDNPGAAKQMNQVTGWPYTIISPNGCHVQLDPSEDCTLKTTAYWLILAMSNEIVTQTQDGGNPISAFSRYASIYGLRGNATLRDSKNCDTITSRLEMSYKQMGNWFCN